MGPSRLNFKPIVSHFEEKAISRSVFNQSLCHLSPLEMVSLVCPNFTFSLWGLFAMKSKTLRMFHLHLLNKVDSLSMNFCKLYRLWVRLNV